jgi:two-component system invasion response regulator UvrY
MIRIVIVDDHHLVRTGLAGIIAPALDMEVIGEADNGEEGVRLARTLSPDVMLMDVEMPGCSGLEATERILRAQPEIAIVVLTAHAEPPLPARLLEAGASAYLGKTCQGPELLEAIRTVARGGRYLSPPIAQQMALAVVAGGPMNPFETLTARELEVAMMLAKGMRPREIACAINLSPKTVSTHKQKVYEKTSTVSEVELLKLAIRHGLVSAPPGPRDHPKTR